MRRFLLCAALAAIPFFAHADTPAALDSKALGPPDRVLFWTPEQQQASYPNMDRIFLTREIWEEGFVGFVGYWKGEAVATAATMTAAGVVGVYNVATLPAYRRRGHGESVVRYALDMARQENNCERTILQATEHGLQLYQSMGYRTVTAVDVYASD